VTQDEVCVHNLAELPEYKALKEELKKQMDLVHFKPYSSGKIPASLGKGFRAPTLQDKYECHFKQGNWKRTVLRFIAEKTSMRL